MITLKHHYPFKDIDNLDSVEAWDTLRKNDSHFYIPKTREEWIKVNKELQKDGQDKKLIERAQEIVDLVKDKKVFSVGVGGAALEYYIKKINPNIHLTCSDYSKTNVEILKNVFMECDNIIIFDVRKDDWSIAKDSIVIMYRIDMDISNEEFKIISKKMYEAGISGVIIVFCSILKPIDVYNAFMGRFKLKLKGISYGFAGCMRTEGVLKNFFKDFKITKLNLAGFSAFYLKP